MQFRRLPVLSALGVLALGACADAPTLVAPRAASSTLAASDTDATAVNGSYIVRFNGNTVPDGFAQRVAELGGQVVRTLDGAGLAVVRGMSESAAATLAGSAGVGEVQPDTQITLATPVAATEADAAGVATDAAASQGNPATAGRYAFQWNMRLIGADKAWAAGKLGSPDVKVAILDTGIDYDAPDLNGLVDLASSTSFVPGDDAITATYFGARNPISDYNGHGTNVATQVSSKARTFAGVTSKTTLMGVKVLGASGSGSFSGIMSGIMWAAQHGADVANMSLGGAFAKAGNGRYVGIIARVLGYAGRQGMLVVVAAGNESENLDHNGNELTTYCSEPHVLCVSSVGPATATANPDTPAFYTNFGRSSVDVAGPGGNADAAHGFAASVWPWGMGFASWVWSYCSKTQIAGYTAAGAPVLTACRTGNRMTGNIGTSQATPHVAGLAALLVAERGHGQPQLVKNLIKRSADDLSQPGVDPYFGAGRINVARALGL